MLTTFVTRLLIAASLVVATPIFDEALELMDRDVEISELDIRDLESRTSKHSTSIADFETLLASTTPTKSIGQYGGLLWTGIGVARIATPQTVGTIPFSPVNVAVFGALSQSLDTVPTITSRYTGSRVANFALNSFYYGCNNGFGLVPTACKIAVAAYDKNNKLIAYKAFNTNPAPGTLIASMVKAVLPSTFQGTHTLKMATTYPDGISGVTVLDNIQYTLTTV